MKMPKLNRVQCTGALCALSLISAAAPSFCSGHCQPETTRSATHWRCGSAWLFLGSHWDAWWCISEAKGRRQFYFPFSFKGGGYLKLLTGKFLHGFKGLKRENCSWRVDLNIKVRLQFLLGNTHTWVNKSRNSEYRTKVSLNCSEHHWFWPALYLPAYCVSPDWLHCSQAHSSPLIPISGTSLPPKCMTRHPDSYLSRCKVFQPHDAQLIHRMNLVVVCWISKSERQ